MSAQSNLDAVVCIQYTHFVQYIQWHAEDKHESKLSYSGIY